MSDDSNPLGGKNPNSLYVPMSEIEQEFVSRLKEKGDLQVRIHGWGIVPNPPVQIGDLQVVIPLTLRFDRPEVPIQVHSFDLELLTGSGVSLFREKQSCEYGGQPIMIGQGTEIQMVWHIGIRAMDPRLVKAYLPGAKGLTSRAFDKDTGDLTLLGNMNLNAEQKRLIKIVRDGEATIRAEKASKPTR
jgi:hypothetical protein